MYWISCIAICHKARQIDSLFRINRFWGGWALFIIDYTEVNVFPGETLLKITRGVKRFKSRANKRAWHIEWKFRQQGLVDAKSDEKYGIYFAWPNLRFSVRICKLNEIVKTRYSLEKTIFCFYSKQKLPHSKSTANSCSTASKFSKTHNCIVKVCSYENETHNKKYLRSLQLGNMFLVHRPHVFLRIWQFEKYWGFQPQNPPSSPDPLLQPILLG